MRRNHSLFHCSAACAAAGLASAQAPQPTPPPAAGTTPEGRERVDSDAQLGLEVQARLNQNLGVSNLSSIVRDGVVTLDGMVRADADLKRAEELALEVPRHSQRRQRAQRHSAASPSRSPMKPRRSASAKTRASRRRSPRA